MDTKRIFLAGFLIVAVWIVWQSFFVSVPVDVEAFEDPALVETQNKEVSPAPPLDTININTSSEGLLENPELFIIKNDLFTATVSSEKGGSFIDYSLSNHLGTYVLLGEEEKHDVQFSYQDPVQLIFNEGDGEDFDLYCNPCIKNLVPHAVTFEGPFDDIKDSSELVLSVNDGEGPKSIIFTLLDENQIEIGEHVITISSSSYAVNHVYTFFEEDLKASSATVLWKNGIRPAERYYWLDDQSSYGMYVAEDGDNNYLTANKNLPKDEISSNSSPVEWAGSRNKFFVSVLAPQSENKGAVITPIEQKDNSFSSKYNRPDNPSAYDVAVTFNPSESVSFDSFIAPLDYSVVKASEIKNLDWIMTMGASLFRPISKFIINTIQFLKNSLPFLGTGVILMLFALLVRIISGPLTKMSFRSTQKMQKVQPLIKEIQEKYKSEPKKMQQMIMQTYKEHKVNPLSGCLLMFLQWPIMIPPFIVFRSIVELRGESFLWIKDLSQPDYLISLPFNIPLIGTNEGWTGIGILPVLMGVTLFLTMKKTMTNIEGQNKIMLYAMNGMFIVLFNSFPAGLNLYYVVYNVLNYLQQRKKDDGSSSLFKKIKGFLPVSQKK